MRQRAADAALRVVAARAAELLRPGAEGVPVMEAVCDGLRAQAQRFALDGHEMVWCVCPGCWRVDDFGAGTVLIGVVHVQCAECESGESNPTHGVATVPMLLHGTVPSEEQLTGRLAYRACARSR